MRSALEAPATNRTAVMSDTHQGDFWGRRTVFAWCAAGGLKGTPGLQVCDPVCVNGDLRCPY